MTQASNDLQAAAPEAVADIQLSDQLVALLHGELNATATAPPPRFRRFLDALGVAVYTANRDGLITYYNDAAADFWGRRPELGEKWCGSWRLFRTDGRPMPHDECPMAICLRENREVRGQEAIAERRDGTRVAFVPYPSPLHDDNGALIGAVNVLVDVTERRNAEDALRSTAQALAASNTVKDEFLGLVSHELRTPVTTIFGNAQLLRDRGSRLAQEDRDEMVADIAGDAERLLSTIENLLLLTRLEAGSRGDLEPQQLGRMATKIVESYRQRNPGRRIELSVPAEPLIVEADEGYLEVLIGNLVNNAVKYSPMHQRIDVSVRHAQGEAEVVVQDRGIGLEDADIEDVFAAFYRSDSARHMGTGVGIGLTVCRRLVEGLGGRIWAVPREDGGSEFGFSLPLANERDLSS
ncbi:MAG: ATP-binding protein [Candidatus Limnocylindrales bacterium]